MIKENNLYPADLILLNGSIYTVDASRSWAESLAVKDGKIIFIGHDNEVKKFKGEDTIVYDLKGKMVLPSFHDSHVHPVVGGLELGECDLTPFRTEEQMLDHLKNYARQHPEKEWIRGGGWQLPVFEDGNPHKSLLDRVVPERPVYLESADAHSAWVNSKALAVAGITKQTADPVNGRIERDYKTKIPSGTLREDAMKLVSTLLPKYSDEDYLKGLQLGMEIANKYGITAVQEASATEKIIKAYSELDKKGKLNIRVVAALRWDSKNGESQLKDLLALKAKYSGKNFKINGIKIFADGVIEAQTAALIEPYIGSDGKKGKPIFEAEELKKLIRLIDKEHLQVHVHAIGDYAVRITL
ncbi:MAG: amidohydrolase, partial [Bacteroidota bacterium]|nr:amidohydrolase [Bacteroidota bacterium]